MSDYVVVIPSYDRSNLIAGKTLTTLKNGGVPKNKIYIFVANEEEEKKYKSTVPKDLYNEIIIGVKGLVEQRKFINNYFEEDSYIISFDDDVEEILEKKTNLKTDNKLHSIKNLPELFNNAYKIMKEKKFFIWGVAPVCNPFFLYNKVSYDLRIIVGPLFGYISRDDEDLDIKYGPNKEDTERTCRYFKKDGGIVRFNHISLKTKYFSDGGINTIEGGKKKRFEKSIKNSENLLNEFPNYGKLMTRKTGLVEFKLILKPKPILSDKIEIIEYRDKSKIEKIQQQILKYLNENPKCIRKIKKPSNGVGEPTRGDKIGNIGNTRTFGFGNRRNLGWSEFEANLEMPELYKLLVELGNAIVPIGFFYNAITFNQGVQAKKHTDGLNNGFSVITGFGNYTGGKLRIYNKEDTAYTAYDLKNRAVMFDGNLLAHETEPFTGDRVTVIYYKQKYLNKLKDFESIGI